MDLAFQCKVMGKKMGVSEVFRGWVDGESINASDRSHGDGPFDVLVQKLEGIVIFETQGYHMQYMVDMDILDGEYQLEGEGDTSSRMDMYHAPNGTNSILAQLVFCTHLLGVG